MRAVAVTVAGLVVSLLLGQTASARYARPDLEKVPVQRLIDNLEI